MNNLSLKWKILLSVTITCIAAVIVTTVVTVRSGIATVEATIIDDTRTLARVLGEASTGAIMFNDSTTVTTSLRALQVSPRVLNAVIYNENDQPFAWYSRGQDSTPRGQVPGYVAPRPGELGVAHGEGQVVITEAIEDQGSQMATIAMTLSMAELDNIVADAASRAFWVVLVISIVSASLGYLLQASIVKPVKNVVSALRDISEGEGDLTRRLPVTGRDEISELAKCFNVFVERLHIIIASVADTSREVNENANTLAQLSKENERSMKSQQAEVQQIVVAVKEMTSVVNDVTFSVSETAEKALEADHSAANGKQIVVNTMGQIENLSREITTASEVIDRLRNETVSIGSVLDVIRGVAEQTNLLALNAAIEAARAGEQGRGFAVVADEVRTLASRTQSSTTEIQEMIERLQVGSKEAVEMMAAGTHQASASVEQASEACTSLEEITHIVSVIRDRTNQIAAASEQQSAATQQIQSNIESISSVAASTAESSSRITSNSGILSEMASRMTELVGRFKL